MIVTLFQQQCEAVKGSCIELCGHLKSRMTLSEALFLRKCSMNHVANESALMYDDLRFIYTSEPGSKPSANSYVLLTSLQHYSMLSLQCFHFFLPMLKHEYFVPIFNNKPDSVIYLYATFIIVVNIPLCVRNFIFDRSFLPRVKKCSNSVPVDSLSSSQRQTFSSHILQSGVIIEIIWNSNFSSKLVCSGMNRLSVWGKPCCSECVNMSDDFYGFAIFRNNDSVWLEETTIEEIIFSNKFGIISLRHLSPNFCGVSSGI